MTGSYAYMLLKAVFSLAVVLALLGLFLYMLKAFMKKTGSRGSASAKPVEVLGVYPLDYKKNLTVVDVAGEVIVLGVTPSSVNLVAKIENPAAMEELKRLGEASQTGLLRFFR
ncbi:MAG: hypothetical protein A3J24_05130 [Deltaproteobacteria bacterium RIFCSPLOWO2_02_FULL_53_8]|nr:MAG: hypothetical protein A3J24_05130 [Deltaproteobacteria bacterium RIFCSPLOWO2_02_FULL_53_8]